MTQQLDNCRLGCKMTLEACEKRQLKRKRWTRTRQQKHVSINPIYLSCVECPNWLSEEDYTRRCTARKGHNY